MKPKKEKKANEWFDKGSEGDDERDLEAASNYSESENSDYEIYDDDLDDQELISRSETKRQKLLNTIGDILDWYKDYKPNQTIYETEEKQREEKIRWEQVSKLLNQAKSDNKDKIKYFDDLILRLTPWIGNKTNKDGTERPEAEELKLIREELFEWKEAKATEYQDKKDDLQQAIDNIKNAIADHLGKWSIELDAIVPKDTAQIKENAKNELLKWETNLIIGLKDFLAKNKKQNLEGHEVELTKKEQKAISAVINQTKNTLNSKKLEAHDKLLKNIELKISQALEQSIPEEDADINDEPNRQLLNYIRQGKQLFNYWKKTITEIAKPTKEQEDAKTLIKFINVALKNSNLPNYKEFLKRAKEVKADDPHLKPFETCPQGFDCAYHTDGNWIIALGKAQAELKGLDKLKKQEEEDKDTPPCQCLHCSHGLGGWTWLSCPFFDTSEQARKLADIKSPSFRGFIGHNPAGTTHWQPPEGWTPFWSPAGTPRPLRINQQLAKMKLDGWIPQDYQWTNHQAQGTKSDKLNKPDKGKKPEGGGSQHEPVAEPKPIFTFPGDESIRVDEPGSSSKKDDK